MRTRRRPFRRFCNWALRWLTYPRPDLQNDEEHFQLLTEHGHIDIHTSIGEMGFDQAWRNRVETEIDGIIVRFISKNDLIENKRQVGRLIDLADVEQLTLGLESVPTDERLASAFVPPQEKKNE